MTEAKINFEDQLILGVIYDYGKDLTSAEFFSEVRKSGYTFKKSVLYRKLQKYRNFGLVESFRIGKTPTYSKHRLTSKGVMSVVDFNEKIQLIEDECRKSSILREKKLIQSVFDFLLEALEKDFEDISKENMVKLERIAEKIVEKVRNS